MEQQASMWISLPVREIMQNLCSHREKVDEIILISCLDWFSSKMADLQSPDFRKISWVLVCAALFANWIRWRWVLAQIHYVQWELYLLYTTGHRELSPVYKATLVKELHAQRSIWMFRSQVFLMGETLCRRGLQAGRRGKRQESTWIPLWWGVGSW